MMTLKRLIPALLGLFMSLLAVLEAYVVNAKNPYASLLVGGALLLCGVLFIGACIQTAEDEE